MKEKTVNPNKIGAAKFLTWSVSGASVAIQAVLLAFFQIYCTNALSLSAALVGTILFVTKIVDGITDLIAGYVVDKTKTRWGKGRPYEFAVIGVWIMTWLLFSVPTEFSMAAKCVWIGVCYTLAQSVFLTLKNAAGNVYMVRAFNNTQKYIKLNSIGGFVSVGMVVVFNVMFPMFYGKVVDDAAGWSRLIGFIAIPMIMIGMLRFFVVKEEYDVDVQSEEKLHFKDVIEVLKTNKYVYIIGLIILISNIVSGANVASYYFLYIVGNIEISGVLSIFGFVAMLGMLFFPLILKKISTARLVQYSLLISIISGTILFLAKDNIAMLAIGGVFNGIVTLPISYLSSILIVECADYNEWKGMRRMEGTLSSVINFTMKVGQALGVLISGFLLTASGFDSTLSAQPDSALLMIRLLYSLIPTALFLFAAFMLRFYKIDKLKPQIDADNEKKRTDLSAKINE